MEETVTLFTRQNEKTLFALEQEGRLVNRKIYIQLHFGDCAPLFIESYEWFTAEASRRVPRPADVEVPIWCAISRENCLRPIEGTVVYELEVPKAHVIYFDEAKWDYVLNHHYLAANEADADAYRRHLKALGIPNGFEFFEGRYKGKYPEEVERIRESWKRVFTIDKWTIFNVCGNLWEIKQEWVKRIVRPGESV